MSNNKIYNWIGGEYTKPKDDSTYLDVENPSTQEVIAQVCVSGSADVDEAVKCATKAFQSWSSQTAKSRALILHRVFEVIRDNTDVIVDLIVKEHGKTRAEAVAEVAKGNETVEFACSYPVLARGHTLEVSRGVKCEDMREPIGVVAHIVPFNFPAMVPLWTIPIALVSGNCVILKPSEKVPCTMNMMARLFKEAGIPDGVFNIVNGTKDAVTAICDHPGIAAVTFVGSSGVAKFVANRCQAVNKRVLAMGGAKNYLVALPDCELQATAADIVASFTGCCGQRCMAASVLLALDTQEGFCDRLVEQVVSVCAGLRPGQGKNDMGPLIDAAALARVVAYVEGAEKRGAHLAIDGRKWDTPAQGHWVGPTVIIHPAGTTPDDPCIKDEIFGPVISVIRVSSRAEAIQWENACGYGNAACVYTSSGEAAEWFARRFTSAMIGVNIGVPVPREPFSFGGMGNSKFGDHGDVTGEAAVDFFTRRRKITSRWPVANRSDNQAWFK